ncbi:alcohol dehydrogenase catalytic domain-containing protein [Sphingomonas sp. 35-24ZXX]|uniref:alcohol dehydrogenase catalytic domain-containing protein n=1 Tax=Sphingomonas sp. 35-24ZXX TaxID=1545915 RepID=UPI00053BEEAD|nr:alcohol dehydrogenase catalytic domain-containing protein [Sphingomonas sp. 35-24ZXX]
MKAAIYAGGGGPVAIETRADPVPGDGDVIIRVDRCGICGTDLAMTRGDAWDYGPDSQFGHEFAGEIVAVGRAVEGLRTGDRIAVLPSVSCGTCALCTSHGNNVLCKESADILTGGFAEYARLPARNATLLPASLSFADGALIEPMAIALYGLRMAGIVAGERVLVLGAGAVACYAIYWARRMGAGRIVAMSRSAQRADMARLMGADALVPFGPDERGEVQAALHGPPSVVLECVGAVGMFAKAVDHAAPFARLVSLGFCTAPDPVTPALAAYKCLSVHFSVGYTMGEFTHIADALDKGHCDPKASITATVGLDQLPAMLGRLRSAHGETKVHVRCS